jgi:hypothetical protein
VLASVFEAALDTMQSIESNIAEFAGRQVGHVMLAEPRTKPIHFALNANDNCLLLRT